jgi:GNAT superfamily N-acetyltransferase
MTEAHLRAMEREDWAEVADLIYVSLNYWCEANGRPTLFRGGPEATTLFCEVYEGLDPGHCVVAEHPRTGRLMGSCFYRERETHVSLGIMNVHPVYFGEGIGKALLRFVCDLTDELGKPLRLVSSAMNLDSFSLYTRAGFVPRLLYQDMLVEVPREGLVVDLAESSRVRDASPGDIDAMAEVELEVSGISRRKDYRMFVENPGGLWGLSVVEEDGGRLGGFLASVGHPLFNEIGPGVARTEDQAAALLVAELNRHSGRTPLVLVPSDATELVSLLHSLGGRNCELHIAQVRGHAEPFRGVSLPTFMPETG